MIDCPNLFEEFPYFSSEMIPYIQDPKILLCLSASIPAAEVLRWTSPYQKNQMLEYAVYHNLPVNARRLLNQVDYSQDFLNVLLLDSCNDDHPLMVDLLLTFGADPNSSYGEPLTIAINKGWTDLIPILVSHGANLHIDGTIYGRYYNYRVDHDLPLASAIMNDHLEMVKVLIREGANIHSGGIIMRHWTSNNINVQKDLPFLIAVREGFSQIADLLLTAGSDVHVNSEMALTTAVENEDVEMVKILLTHGADPHRFNLLVITSSLEIVRLLLIYGASPDIPYMTFLDLMENHPKIADLLLEYGYPLKKNQYPLLEEALYLADTEHRYSALRYLLDHGIRPLDWSSITDPGTLSLLAEYGLTL